MISRLGPRRTRWIVLLLVGAILAGLSPTAAPRALGEHLTAAQQSLQEGDPQVAVEHLEAVLRLEPSLAILHRSAAMAAVAAGQLGQALTHLEEIELEDQRSTEAICLRLEAEALRQGPSWEAQIPDSCPQAARLHRLRAQAFYSAGQPQPALAEILESVRLAPDDPASQRLLAMWVAASNPSAAGESLEAARRLSGPGDVLLQDLTAALQADAGLRPSDVALRVGQTFLKHDRPVEAVEAFEHAVDLSPMDPAPQAYLAFARSRKDPQAITALQQLREEAPDVILPYLLEAIVLREAGTPSRAIPLLQAALARAPESPALLAELGAAYLGSGDLPRAAQWYRRAAEAAGVDPSFWLLLSRFSLEQAYDIAGIALPAARNAVGLNPGNEEGWDLLGHAQLLAGDGLLAERALLTSLALDPQNVSAYYHLGLLRLQLGDPIGAAAALQAAIQLDPASADAELARRSLESIEG